MRFRSYQWTHRAQFELRADRRGLFHLLKAHVDNPELSMGDSHAIHAGIATSFDESEGTRLRTRWGGRQLLPHPLRLS
jgi:hypothetical protein